MLIFGTVTQENLILLAIVIALQIPIAHQDLRKREMRVKSWFRVSVIASWSAAALAVLNRIIQHGSWHNTLVGLVMAVVWSALMYVFWRLAEKDFGGGDVQYYVYCLIPLSLVAPPIWIITALALSQIIAWIIGKIQHTPVLPVITGMVGAGALSAATLLLVAH